MRSKWDFAQRIGLGMMVCGLIAFVSGDAGAGPVCLGLFLVGAAVYGVANLGATFGGAP